MLFLSPSIMLMTWGAGFPFFSIVTSGARCSTLARRYPLTAAVNSVRHRLGLELAGLLGDVQRDGLWLCHRL